MIWGFSYSDFPSEHLVACGPGEWPRAKLKSLLGCTKQIKIQVYQAAMIKVTRILEKDELQK